MDFQDFKLLFLNVSTFLAIEFSSADAFLKFILVAISIGYTTHKWYLLHTTNKKAKKDNKKSDEDI